jgi:hypothetical protein
VAFSPAEFGPTSNWLRLDLAVIDDAVRQPSFAGVTRTSLPNTQSMAARRIAILDSHVAELIGCAAYASGQRRRIVTA